MLKDGHSLADGNGSLRSVEVVVRIRPVEFADGEGQETNSVSVSGGLPKRLTVLDPCGWCGAGEARSFLADTVLEAGVSNAEVFRRVVKPKLAGVSREKPDTLCFLAYGHTSSGKTHTIAGGWTYRTKNSERNAVEVKEDEESGLLTLCVEELLQREGVVEVAMLEVYMENIYDLLAQGVQRHVRRRRSSSGDTHVVVEGLKTCIITSKEQWKAVARYGMRSRRTTATERNARSSRSHALFTVKSPSVRLCFVDLAGSERQTTFSAQLNKESVSINKSLSRLSTALQALSEQQPNSDGRRPYVNFRDTTLTVLLQRYLVGSSHTTFLACVHPAERNVNETMSTLRYTERIRRIKTSVHTIQDDDPYQDGMALYDEESNDRRLLEEIAQLREKVRDHEEARQLLSTHRQRIAELEASLLEQQQKASRQASLVPTVSGSVDPEEPQQRWKQQIQQENARTTRRLTRWLLTRVLRDLPPLHVRFDDYFDDLLPPCVQVVGYVSTLRCLPPRRGPKVVGNSVSSSSGVSDLSKEEEGLCFLDVGDFSIGLSMLDGGVPSLVRLHQARCNGVSTWEPYETRLATTLPPTSFTNSISASSSRHATRQSNPVVHFGYVLAFFQTSEETVELENPYSSAQEEEADDEKNVDVLEGESVDWKGERGEGSPSGPPMSCCCAGRISKEPLVPLAVVWCVQVGAPLHVKESALQRLAMLVQQEDMTSALGMTPQANRTHKGDTGEKVVQALHSNTLTTMTAGGTTATATVQDLSSTIPDGEQSRARQDEEEEEEDHEEDEEILAMARRPDPVTSLPLLKHINDVLLAVPPTSSAAPTTTRDTALKESMAQKHEDVMINQREDVKNDANTRRMSRSILEGKAPLFHSDDEEESGDDVMPEQHRKAPRCGALYIPTATVSPPRTPVLNPAQSEKDSRSSGPNGGREELAITPMVHSRELEEAKRSSPHWGNNEGNPVHFGSPHPEETNDNPSGLRKPGGASPMGSSASTVADGHEECGEEKVEKLKGNSPPHYNAAVDYLRGVEREVENCLLRAATNPEPEPVRSTSVSSSFYSEYDDSRCTGKEVSRLPDEVVSPHGSIKVDADDGRKEHDDSVSEEEQKQVLVSTTERHQWLVPAVVGEKEEMGGEGPQVENNNNNNNNNNNAVMVMEEGIPIHPSALKGYDDRNDVTGSLGAAAAAAANTSTLSPSPSMLGKGEKKKSKLGKQRKGKDHLMEDNGKAVELSKCQECFVM